jgi:S-DNA-T family DNA segregation ATPase FtsK/SpoIIIE
MNYTPDEVNMYILDFGGGSLNMYNSLPHIGGIVLPEDGDKLSMLTRMLEAELNKRKKLFAKAGLTNIGAYKSANPGERMPYILLMIDNYAYAVQSYPDLPDFLLTYIRDGANYGMYFINAVSTTSSMSFRLSENIKNKLSLYMSEKADYNSIFSMPPGITIDNIKGHGICKLD